MVSHPWRELRHLPHIRVSYVDMPAPWCAMTNGVDLIWMDKHLYQVERRVHLQHELEHIKRGHRGHQPPAIELGVRITTAHKLITFEDLMKARAWSGHNYTEMADELWVTPEVLFDRINYLKGEERRAFDAFDD
ncbi:ImmA/IrrE family metallo-endopeptidase [Arthrobacter sp. N1]|uniref:ImmA/IrrE family metallo-endopeptidase n=1 Tax=Arthrobacter sp. N1 TaxID=619291 RepID=UPI003BB124F0